MRAIVFVTERIGTTRRGKANECFEENPSPLSVKINTG